MTINYRTENPRSSKRLSLQKIMSQRFYERRSKFWGENILQPLNCYQNIMKNSFEEFLGVIYWNCKQTSNSCRTHSLVLICGDGRE